MLSQILIVVNHILASGAIVEFSFISKVSIHNTFNLKEHYKTIYIQKSNNLCNLVLSKLDYMQIPSVSAFLSNLKVSDHKTF